VIADVVFDIPLTHPFSYRVPPEVTVAVGQRVRAPLQGRTRVGVVVACREGDDERLKALSGPVEPVPLLRPRGLDLARWIASESYSSWGSTCAALLPPLPPRAGLDEFKDLSAGMEHRAESPEGGRTLPQLLTGGDREERVLNLLASRAEGGVLVLAPEIGAAAAWAHRLGRCLGESVVRLDSGRPDAERWRAWMALSRGTARVAVGTRSGLLAPLPPSAVLVLLDENDPAHKPPGHPRIHSREVVLHRHRQDGCSVVLTAATPSVESWWQADSGRLVRVEGSPAAWPEVSVVDARGGLRRSPLSPELQRSIRETIAGGGQVCLLVTRIAAVLACGECGFLLRCPDCEIPLAYLRVSRECSCRVCGRREPAPDTCSHCRGRQLAPLGWGSERVEQVVRRAFPRIAVGRYDSRALTLSEARQLARRWEEGAVRLVVGTKEALKALRPGGRRLVGVVTPDHLLRLPDFRAGERAFALLWAAAEWAGGEGRLIVQTQHLDHYAVRAVAAQELGTFYKPELKFRAEAGYPPFRRLAVLAIRGRDATRARALAEECSREIERVGGLTVFPPAPVGRAAEGSRWRIVLKGGSDLAERLRPALAPFLESRRAPPGVVQVEMDPVELV
jgi:primosomal protein N' (replication factor Y)